MVEGAPLFFSVPLPQNAATQLELAFVRVTAHNVATMLNMSFLHSETLNKNGHLSLHQPHLPLSLSLSYRGFADYRCPRGTHGTR